MIIDYSPRDRDIDIIRSVDGTFADKFQAPFSYNPSAGFDDAEFISGNEINLNFAGGDILVPTDQADFDSLYAEL